VIRTIRIVGLGQIGGSLVLALRKRKAPFEISGVDISQKRLLLLSSYLDERAGEPDLTIVCLHFQETLNFLQSASASSLILDVCSSKKTILEQAVALGLRFVGGHPLAGNERAGEEGWDENLFEHTPFFLAPLPAVAAADIDAIADVVRVLGAYPLFVDPAEHDRQLAMTSHFPAFLSVLLEKCSQQSGKQFQGPAYKSMTRLAASPPELLATFLKSNRENILRVAKHFEKGLREWIAELET